MPKVNIREIDNTGTETLEYLDYTVLIPGPYLEYSDGVQKKVLQGLFTKASDFNKTFTNVTFNNKVAPYAKDIGFLTAYELLKNGLTVFFVPTYEYTSDTTKVLVDCFNQFVEITDLDAAQTYLKKLFQEFTDKGKYDLRFISIGGIDDSLLPGVFDIASQEALTAAGDRGDSVAVLGVPETCNLQNIDFFYEVYYKDVEETSTQTVDNEEQTVTVTVRHYSPTPEEGYTLEYLEKDEAEAIPEIEENIDEYNFYNYFEVYQKGDEYSKAPVVGYNLVRKNLEWYNNVPTSVQAKCTPITSDAQTLDNSTKIDTWVKETFQALAKTTIERSGVSWSTQESSTETYGRYGSIFAPACTMNFYINNKSETIKVPAWFDYLICFAKHIKNYKAWFAMSGSVRGVSPYAPIPSVLFGDADVNNVLQIRTCDTSDTDRINHIATNVICEIRPYGNILWGNRTMHPLNVPDNADSDSAVQLVASSFLNIRQLCCSIKKTLYRAARRFTFEPNSDTLWYNFKSVITPLLDEMKANQGIKGYQIIKVKTNKKALLVARIRIVPIEAVEDFDLTVELADSIEVTE